eukprot:2528263-Rhodomonas_salina.3
MIHELKLQVNQELGAIQQNLTQELANDLLKIESDHNKGEEVLSNVQATLEEYKKQIENNTQEMKTEMKKTIQDKMNEHVAELKQQLQTIINTQHTQPANAPLQNRIAVLQIQELDTKITNLQETIKGIIENATEAKLQGNYCNPHHTRPHRLHYSPTAVQLTISPHGCLPAVLIQGLNTDIKVIDEWVGPRTAWITDAVG